MLLLLFLLAFPPDSTGAGQVVADPGPSEGRFALSGYGSLNYFAFDWDTDPDLRNAIDVERLVFYPVFHFNERTFVKAEIEIEHGGTGVTKEFDRFEEFGEFETEVEAGGEVLLEQLHVDFALSERFGVRVGRVKLPFGIGSYNDEPTEYFTTLHSPAEAALVPTNWYEVGVQAYGRLGDIGYAASLVNGLDATGFSSANWVVRGHQKRFETINADAPALALRLDWFYSDATPDSRVGASFYVGDSAPNRPKPDLDASAVVAVGDVHATWERGPLKVRALALYGHLGNADLVSQANRNLSNALNVKRTPVGSAALAYYAEAGYDVLSLLAETEQRLDVFARYAFYDSMYEVTGEVFDNPRWERTAITGGLNWFPLDEVVLKAQYTHRRLGLDEANIENTFTAGIGFEF